MALAGTWKFGEKRGAVLLMHLPQLWKIPNMKLLDKLVDVPEVKGKYIVSDAYTCPASSLYISGKSRSLCSSSSPSVIRIPFAGSEEVTITLHAEVDPLVAGLAAGVPIGAGGGVKAGWSVSNATGIHQCAGSTKSSRGRNTPLFTLKKRRWYAKWRGVPQAPIDPNQDK